MSVDGVIRDIRQKGLRGLYLLCGEETFLRDRALSQLVDEALAPELREFNLAVLDAESCPVEEIINAMMASPVFAPRRVSIVKSFDSLKAAGQAQVLKAASRMPKANVVFLLAGPVSDSTMKAASKAGRVVEFKPLYEGEAVKWVVRRGEQLGLRIGYPVAHHIVASCGCDLRLLATELDKLATYVGGQPREGESAGKGPGREGDRHLTNARHPTNVTIDQVDLIIGKSAEVTVFDLVEAIGMRDARKALEELKFLMDRKEDPVKITGSIAWQVRTVLQSKLLRLKNLPAQGIANEMKKPLFVVRKYLAQAQNFSLEELENAIHLVLRCDLDIKAGQIPARVALERLIISLCHNAGTQRRDPAKQRRDLAQAPVPVS
ncbi:MAG TPA: hypothetical protein GX506_06945 [Firmicutes bacterium]|nr:hypothetical protein [Bacillota bacterium]